MRKICCDVMFAHALFKGITQSGKFYFLTLDRVETTSLGTEQVGCVIFLFTGFVAHMENLFLIYSMFSH